MPHLKGSIQYRLKKLLINPSQKYILFQKCQNEYLCINIISMILNYQNKIDPNCLVVRFRPEFNKHKNKVSIEEQGYSPRCFVDKKEYPFFPSPR